MNVSSLSRLGFLPLLALALLLPSTTWGQARSPRMAAAAQAQGMTGAGEETAREMAGSPISGRLASASRPSAAPRAFQTPSRGYRPTAKTTMPTAITHPPIAHEGAPGDVVMHDHHPGHEIGGDYFAEGDVMEGDSCGPECDGGGCGSCGHCVRCLCLPIPRLYITNLEAFGGVQGFTGPANRGGTGSFGFHEGFNWGGGLPLLSRAVSVQAGARATQTNFNGTDFTLDDRQQVFVTGGLFRRVDCGLQGGVVVDYMHDEWYYSLDLLQLRGELSWVFGCEQEVGFWGAAGFDERTVTSTFRTAAGGVIDQTLETFKPNDIYAFFYRQQLGCGGEGRIWGGFTGLSDGLIGADFRLPVTTCVDLQSNFTYLIPKQNINDGGVEEESWNLSIGLVWYPGCRQRCGSKYDRPLLNVADNGNFLFERRAAP